MDRGADALGLGREGYPHPPAVGHLLRAEIPDSGLLIMKGAAHVPMTDRPEEFNAALLAFLRGEPVGK